MLRTHKIVRLCIAECLAFLGLVSVLCSVGFPWLEQGADLARQSTSPSSLSSVRMLENDQGNIHKLDMKSIHSCKGFSWKNSTLGYMCKTSTTRHLLKAVLTVVKPKALLSQTSEGQSTHWMGMSQHSQAQETDQGTVIYAHDSTKITLSVETH